MTSTTTSKKELVDFLWEWAENHGEWSKLLVDKVVTTESSLSHSDRATIFNYFLQSIKLHTGLQSLTITKPAYTPTGKRVELTSLSDITGVNRLAKNQTLNFAPNISIIYGENGTGKTGYGRILKSFGFSYDSNNSIYANIFGSSEPKSALINFEANGVADTFTWDGTNRNQELESISVFNNNCVQISLSDRQLIVSPIGFHLFNIISGELKELEKLLQTKIASHPTALVRAETLHEGTPQQIFINGLKGTSTEEKLTELSSFSSQQEKELKDKETELNNLNKQLLLNEVQNLTLQETEINSLVTKIQTAESLLSPNNWDKLIKMNGKLAELQKQAKKGIKEIAESNGIEFYETREFQLFIQSAENYIKILNKPEYPNQEDLCVYCKQPLEKSAEELLRSYRKLLNDKTQENIKQLKQQKEQLINQILQVDTNLLLHQSSFGLDNDEKPIQPEEITDYNKELGVLKTTFVSDRIVEGSTFDFDYNKLSEFLKNKNKAIKTKLVQKKEVLSNLAAKENELKKKIAELKDRKLLSTKQAEVKSAIANHKIVSVLNSNYNNFNTNSISRKTTEAREALVKQNFNNIFQGELKALRKSNIKIELNFATDRGKSRVSQKIENHVLTDILSEGEQKAIALAEFLTELQLDNIEAPVIFDDPVNSLDHRIIDEVAKRLIELSKQRQVIVFTHSILLLNSFIQQSELDTNKQAGVKFAFRSVSSSFGETGIIDDVEEINSYTYYTKKLNLLLETKPNGQSEEEVARKGYGHLRSAIEVAVEENLLKKTVKRYAKGVAFPSLLRIDGDKIDKHKGKLNDIYEKCCVSIDGHSSPRVIHTTPTIDELKIDYDEFKKLRKEFT
jgi:ABC-type polar amino acid transport system ATPase subunit